MSDASAPGKLVIIGEYAVLHGAPAIVTAVDVRARATAVRSTDGQRILVDSASNQEFGFRCDRRHGFQWVGDHPGERGEILQAVLATLLKQMPDISSIPPVRISMDTDGFYRIEQAESRKLGLGSSAAVLVALTGALFDALGVDIEAEDATQFCIAAHRHFQGGHGSGADIAAAINGGVLGVRATDAGANISIDRLDWPDGLFILPVWSGESASTVDLLSRFYLYRNRKPDEFDGQIRILTNHAERAQAAWLDQSVQNVLAAMDGYDEALRLLDHEAAIGIQTDIHERLRTISKRHGARYKTSGAGGGDLGIAYTDSAAVADEVRSALIDAGFYVLESPLSTSGLTVDSDC